VASSVRVIVAKGQQDLEEAPLLNRTSKLGSLQLKLTGKCYLAFRHKAESLFPENSVHIDKTWHPANK
jgi:hypothetical protein